MENLRHIIKIFKRYRKGKATAEESAKIESWYNQLEVGPPAELSGEQLRQLEAKTFHFPKNSRTVRPLWTRVAAAIVAVMGFSLILWVWLLPGERGHRLIVETDYQPADAHVVLSIDNVPYTLDRNHEGIEMIGDSVCYIDPSSTGNAIALSSTTLSQSPRQLSLRNAGGRTYSVRLPDGTLVWLNAYTQIDYPERFDGAERVVKLIGEAYFEVHPSDQRVPRPFIVQTTGQRIEVTGTKFNVRAYDENATVATTLLEGQVTVRPEPPRESESPSSAEYKSPHRTDLTTTLSPNQQSILDKQTGQIRVSKVDPHNATAWMQGLFRFEAMNLEDIMAEIRRWYNVDVVFDQESIRTEKFGGSIPRDASLSDVLNILTLTETVKFKIESKERRIRVMN